MLQNVHRIEGDIAYISLTQGQETMIDVADLQKALTLRWYASHIKESGTYYVQSTLNGKRVVLPRYLLDSPTGVLVDHINHNPLDNRRANLRHVDHAGNAQNRLPKRNTELQLLNIWPQRHKDGYMAYSVVVKRGTQVRRKNFPYTPEGLEAAKAQAEEWRNDIQAPEPERKHRRNGEVPVVPNADHIDKRLPARPTSKLGIRGVSIHKTKKGYPIYVFRCQIKACPIVKCFPYSEGGLSAAKAFAALHYAAVCENT